MKFLSRVALDIMTRSQGKLEDVCVVFPNKRAALFFADHLKEQLSGPSWLPRMITMEEFVNEFSVFSQADDLLVNLELFRIFKSRLASEEDFDQFYSWGRMLSRDFDELDKQLVNAQSLFQVLLDEKEIISGFSYLSDEQIQVIRRFWNSFSPPDFSDAQRNFLHLWKVLYPVYDELKQALRSRGVGYAGMIQREVAENAVRDGLDLEQYSSVCFVGFHLLTSCEEAIFNAAGKAGKALYYWDVDEYYMQKEYHEASRYLRSIVRKFPSAIPASNTFESAERNINVVGIPLSMGQAIYTSDVLNKDQLDPLETAVILPDEHMLFAILQSLPSEHREVNITMGYPLRGTYAYSLVHDVIDLENYSKRNAEGIYFYYKPFFRLLTNPLIHARLGSWCDEFAMHCRAHNKLYIGWNDIGFEPAQVLLAGLFDSIGIDPLDRIVAFTGLFLEESDHEPDAVQKEFIFQVHTQLKKFNELLKLHRISFGKDTLFKVLKQDLRNMRVPFSGEPLKGLQVMGTLETRSLDFKNVFILDMNEGVFPTDSRSGSFIPYHLRKGFGLPTQEHQDSIYAYIFYRLLHKAENVYLIYNTQSEGQRRSEMSRYILQLQHESGFSINFKKQSQNINIQPEKPVSIVKNEAIMRKLERYTSNSEKPVTLSPSALNSYLDCRFRFYLRYIAGVEESRNMSEEMDPATFGNLIHYTMETIYSGHVLRKGSTLVNKKDFAALSDAVLPAIDAAFREEFQLEGEIDFTGDNLVVRSVIETYAREVLKVDESYAPFHIVGMEGKSVLPVDTGNSSSVVIGGTVDRIDIKDGILRVLDYKTGSEYNKASFESVAALFHRENDSRRSYVFQVMLYAYIIGKTMSGNYTRLQPGLLFVRELMSRQTDPRIILKHGRKSIPVDDIAEMSSEFESFLLDLLREIMNPEVPFDQVENRKICDLCTYKQLCHRD